MALVLTGWSEAEKPNRLGERERGTKGRRKGGITWECFRNHL